jgi:D-glycero-alpha-D-manno-heptose-7-phosphate kinase
MIVSRTPLRISLFGGGTDYPEYFNRKHGAVIGMGIDKYVYVTAMPLSPLHPYRYRLYWSKIERCADVEQITHPVVREVLKFYRRDQPTGFSIIADLPALNGLGSSSAFTVGFINSIALCERDELGQLAKDAIYIERDVLKENGGWQDQYLCAYGGFNRVDFYDGIVKVTPVQCSWTKELTESMFLIHTGDSRFSSDVCKQQCDRNLSGENDVYLDGLVRVVNDATWFLSGSYDDISCDDGSIAVIGQLLDEGWNIKKKLSTDITNAKIDELYGHALDSGAAGGKLCGAGSGGFMLVVVPVQNRKRFMDSMRNVTILPVKLAESGSEIVLR